VRKRQLLERASIGALAGIAAGLLAGAGARIAMRMVADGVVDAVRRLPEFTLEGTAGIIIAGAIVGAPFGVLFEAIRERIPAPARWRGVIFSAVWLALIGPFFFSGEEFFTQGRILLFALLFPIYGIALGLALAPSRRIATAMPLALQAIPATIALVGGGLVTIGVVSLALQSTGLLPM